MVNISVYDTEAKEIEKICEDYGITEAELIQALMDIIRAPFIRLSDWL